MRPAIFEWSVPQYSEQNPQTGPVLCPLRAEVFAEHGNAGFPCFWFTVAGNSLGPVRVVEIKQACLMKNVRGSPARVVIGIALDLGRAPLMALHHQSRGETAESHGGGIEEWIAGDQFFRLFHIRNNSFERLPRASRQTGQRQRGAHQLQKITPVEIRRFRIVGLKLVVL